MTYLAAGTVVGIRIANQKCCCLEMNEKRVKKLLEIALTVPHSSGRLLEEG